MNKDQLWVSPVGVLLSGVILGIAAGVYVFEIPKFMYRAKHAEVSAEVLTVPPGFILVTNQLGQWRAAYADSSCDLTPFPGEDDGTREQAISRARRQYEFLCDRDASLWIKAE